MKIKVGSLFDGIGGAPLAAIMSGAEPVWASEIEKIPVSITERHFPNMTHYGDITEISGSELEPVDLIVGGSPCQDLSVAGKRAGLEGERSGLFMDQVRIVKEMRDATRRETGDGTDELPRPRYMVWENVPGALSSNKGEDFRAVLEEVCRIGEEEVSIPRPPKGKWFKSGTILGDGYSVAWRIVDAQHWGVPQRRRRIYLVADFGGQSAPEICFERESVPGDITESREAGEGVATDAERSSGATSESGIICSATQQANAERYWNLCPTITASAGMGGGMEPWIAKSYSLQGNMIGRADHNGPQGSGVNEDVSFTLNTVDRHAVCYDGSTVTSPTNAQNPKPGDPCHTLGTDSRNYVCYGVDQQGDKGDAEPIVYMRGFGGRVSQNGKTPTLEAAAGMGGNNQPIVCYGISSYHSNSMKSSNPHSGVYEADTSRTIDQNGGNPACNQGGIAVVEPVCFEPRSPDGVHRIHGDISPTLNTAQGGQRQPCVMSIDGDPHAVASPERKYVVRRLTPLECERLQGFPDGWTATDVNGKTVSDTQRYKALGNSFAMPNAFFFISRVIRELRKDNHEP